MGENPSNIFPDTVSTMFGTHGRANGRTNRQKTQGLRPHYTWAEAENTASWGGGDRKGILKANTHCRRRRV